jgi:hypothetical protein
VDKKTLGETNSAVFPTPDASAYTYAPLPVVWSDVGPVKGPLKVAPVPPPQWYPAKGFLLQQPPMVLPLFCGAVPSANPAVNASVHGAVIAVQTVLAFTGPTHADLSAVEQTRRT